MSERSIEPFGDDLDREVPNARRVHEGRRQRRVPMGEDDSVSQSASKMPDGLQEIPANCVVIRFVYSGEIKTELGHVRSQLLSQFGVKTMYIDEDSVCFPIDQDRVETLLPKLRQIWQANPPLRTDFDIE